MCRFYRSKMSNDKILDKEYIDLEEWNNLISSPYFPKLVEHLENRNSRHQRNVDKLTKDLSLDNSVKQSAILSRRDENLTLLSFFKSMVERKRQIDNKLKGE